MPTIPPMNLPAESTPWAREIQRRVLAISNKADQAHAYAKDVALSQNSVLTAITTEATTSGIATSWQPIAPLNLIAVSSGNWDSTGLPFSQVALSWDAVALNINGTAAVIGQYDVFYRLSTDDPTTSRLFTSILPPSGPGATPAPSATIAPLTPGLTYVFKVRALGSSGVWGDFSSELSVLAVAPVAVLAAPSTPTVISKLGVIAVSWDGLLTTGAPPIQFSRLHVEMSATSGGTYAPNGQTLTQAGTIAITGLTVGATQWFRLVATDSRGVASPPSVVVSQAVTGVDLSSLNTDVTGSIASANQSGLTGQAAAAAAQSQANTATANAATAQSGVVVAQASADGKSEITYAPSAPVGTGALGDTWFKRDSSGIISGHWDWMGNGVPHASTSGFKTKDSFGNIIAPTNLVTNPSFETAQ
jgi:hypothetical protein